MSAYFLSGHEGFVYVYRVDDYEFKDGRGEVKAQTLVEIIDAVQGDVHQVTGAGEIGL